MNLRKRKPPTKSKGSARDISNPSYPVVGIGASAGGLKAITHLLKALPEDLPIALVIIQHLDPSHESSTVDILSKATGFPISLAKDREKIISNHAYVLPAGSGIVVEKGRLRLTPRNSRPGRNFPIDAFFESLASEKGNRAIGIILSGTGTDGTRGLHSIKTHGGTTFAQDSASAEFGGMPDSAVDSGNVDSVGTPEKIAKHLVELSRLTPSLLGDRPDDGRSLIDIFNILKKATHADFSQYKSSTVQRRISRRMTALKIKDHKTYATYLESHPEEVANLFAESLIHVTRFFRDPKEFDFLKEKLFPKVLKNHPDRPFRVWVAGCSTGEEAYSIAITFFEYLESKKIAPIPLQIFATDISEPSLRTARTGFYPEGISKDLNPSRLKRFFERVDGGYKVSKSLRESCIFSKHDCTTNPPFAKVDLISCRNLLIYFSTELQKQVLATFHYALNPDAILWLGPAETTGDLSNLFAPADRKFRFYFKKLSPSLPKLQLPLGRYVLEKLGSASKGAPIAISRLDLQKTADRITIAEYAPPCVVVNSAFEILQAHGHTAPYLELPSGQSSLNLLKMVRREFVIELRSMLQTVTKRKTSLRSEGLILRGKGPRRTCSIRIIPIQVAPSHETFYAIYFEESRAVPEATKGAKKTKKTLNYQKKLLAHEEFQNALTTDYEATQEALTASNEELQSTNEELQSTNEELETAKEELQASNEELSTVNDELQTRNNELAQTTSDLNNLIASVDIPMVMIGQDSKVRRVTPTAAKTLNLRPGDEGKPIAAIKPDLQIRDLDKSILEVMSTSAIRESEIQDSKGKWHRLQIRPYRTSENQIDGAVITLIEIDLLKRTAEELKKSRDDSIAIIEGSPVPLLAVGADRKILLANKAFYQNFDLSEKDTARKLISETRRRELEYPETHGNARSNALRREILL